MNFRKHRLMNEMGEVDAGGADGLDVSTLSSYSDSGEENDFEIGSDTDALKAYGLDPNKYGLDKKDATESPKAESQGSDQSKAAGQETDENAWLAKVNEIGAIHNENPIKIETVDQLKEFIQKGQDYTQKTQSLSEERKAWDNEKSGAEKELNTAIQELNTHRQGYEKQLQELEQWTFTLNQIRDNSPDLFEEIQRVNGDVQKQFSNPVLDQQLAAIRAELAETKKGLAQREDKLIVDSFESEYAALSATEQSLKELGITVNKDEVKKKWAATGLSPEEVIGSMYGMKALQAQASKSKVETTKTKIQAKPVGIGSKSRPGAKQPVIDPGLKGFDRAMAMYKQLQG